MARRYTPEKREVSPDIRYHNLDVQEERKVQLQG